MSAIDPGDQFLWEDHGRKRKLNVVGILDRTTRQIARFQLRDKLKLYKANTTFVSGYSVENLTLDTGDEPSGTYWAFVETVGGSVNTFRGLQDVATTTHRVVIRNPDRPTEALICQCVEATQ